MSAKGPLQFLALIGAFIGAVAHADCAADYCSSVLVEEIYVESGLWGDTVWIQTSGTEANLNCTANAGIFLRLSSSMSERRTVFAALLTAQATDRPVYIRVAGGSQDCLIGYVRLLKQ